MQFGEWFVAQFGKRPCREEQWTLDRIAHETERQAAQARDLASATRAYDDMRRHALLAWWASHNDGSVAVSDPITDNPTPEAP